MKTEKSLVLGFGFIIALLTVPALAETIISVDDQPLGCLVIYNGQGYRVGWTQADTYDAVTISARLSSWGAADQTGHAYLTTQIGPGTTTANEIASTPFTFPLEPSDLILFQGLHLAPGSYYLSIIGDSGAWGSCWNSEGVTNANTAADVSPLGGFGAAGGLSAYFPATPVYLESAVPTTEFKVQGTDVTHPVLQIAPSGNYVLIHWSTNSAAFVLQSADALTPTNWQTIAVSPVVISDRFVFVTNSIGTMLFRLTKRDN